MGPDPFLRSELVEGVDERVGLAGRSDRDPEPVLHPRVIEPAHEDLFSTKLLQPPLRIPSRALRNRRQDEIGLRSRAAEAPPARLVSQPAPFGSDGRPDFRSVLAMA